MCSCSKELCFCWRETKYVVLRKGYVSNSFVTDTVTRCDEHIHIDDVSYTLEDLTMCLGTEVKLNKFETH